MRPAQVLDKGGNKLFRLGASSWANIRINGPCPTYASAPGAHARGNSSCAPTSLIAAAVLRVAFSPTTLELATSEKMWRDHLDSVHPPEVARACY